jgi:hypothetical protein
MTQISRKKTINTIIAILLVVLVLLGVGYLFLSRDPALMPGILARFGSATSAPSLPDPQSSPDAQAAIAAVTAFYTLNYTEPADQWQARVCALTTPDGCQIFQAFFAPAVRRVVEANQVETGCTVQAVRLVEDAGGIRTWLLEVTLSAPWPGETGRMLVYAEVARQSDGTWLFNRILFDQEAVRFATPAP